MKTITTLFYAASILTLTACGGGGGGTPPPPPPTTYATALAYQNPAGSGYRLVQNAGASTATHLVLDLVGPSGTQGKGVAIFLSADGAKVSWVHPSGASGHLLAGGVFPLGTAPQLLKDKVEGGLLQAGVFQKGGSATTLGAAPLLSLALDLKGSTVAQGAVSLAPQSGKQAVLLAADDSLTPITINVGTLNAQ